jgi:MFS family permease
LGKVGAFIVQYTTWRWAYWSISWFCLFIQLIAFFALPETYTPRILNVKARRLRQTLRNPYLRTEWEDKTLSKLLRVSLTRPWKMLGTQPIIQALAVYQAFNFGMLYLIISSLPKLWKERYGMATGVASLNYLALLGSLVGSLFCGSATDALYRYLTKRDESCSNEKEDPVSENKEKKSSKGVPEFRLPLMIPASLLSAAGIFLFGWSAQAKLHWIVPDVCEPSNTSNDWIRANRQFRLELLCSQAQA